LPARKSESDPSNIQQLERLSQKRANVSVWATYDSEGQNVIWRQEGKLAQYRPMLPMSTGSCDVRLLARRELGNDDQQVVVKNFKTGKEFRRFSVDQGIIDFMWCDLLCPIYQLAQLVNWPKFFRQFVNPCQFVNWFPIYQSLLTYCLVLNLVIVTIVFCLRKEMSNA